jgi:hypothetical protein
MSLQNLKVQSYILFEPENTMQKMSYSVTLQVRSQIDGSDLWAIYSGGNVLDKSANEFTYEPSPSNRDEQFFKDCRFSTAEEAYNFWIEHHEEQYRQKIESYSLAKNKF